MIFPLFASFSFRYVFMSMNAEGISLAYQSLLTFQILVDPEIIQANLKKLNIFTYFTIIPTSDGFILILSTLEKNKWSQNGSSVEPFSCPQDGPLSGTL